MGPDISGGGGREGVGEGGGFAIAHLTVNSQSSWGYIPDPVAIE